MMVTARAAKRTAQVWVEPVAHDPEAASALAVARARLAAGHALVAVRRARCFELRGTLPDRAGLEALLHRSTWFYNPHKERCTVRLSEDDPAPVGEGERAVLVTERGLGRRAAPERWWKHQTGSAIEVREGVAWVLGFAPGTDTAACAASLAETRDRAHGLLANPHAQETRVAGARVPLPWMPARRRAAAKPREGA
jgi:hypothetical protein